MVVKNKMEDLFAEFSGKCQEIFGDYFHYDGEFYILSGGERRIVGYKTCIEDAYIDKGNTFGMHSRIVVIFDEFISKAYMENEIQYFQQTIKNIVRNEKVQNVTIFMLGNTVSKYCPYFDFFGIDISEIKQGQIGVLRDQNGGTVAVEYCANRVDEIGKKKTSEYFGFNNPTSRMILHGEWEYNDCNTDPLDGIKWSDKRTLIKCYVTGLKNVYEMSIHEGKNPVAFIRTVNTQNGIVNKQIKYNLSFDNSVELCYADYGIVPKYRKISEEFMDEDVVSYIKIIKECIKCGRVVFQSIEIGTEFQLAFEGILK